MQAANRMLRDLLQDRFHFFRWGGRKNHAIGCKPLYLQRLSEKSIEAKKPKNATSSTKFSKRGAEKTRHCCFCRSWWKNRNASKRGRISHAIPFPSDAIPRYCRCAKPIYRYTSILFAQLVEIGGEEVIFIHLLKQFCLNNHSSAGRTPQVFIFRKSAEPRKNFVYL